MATARQRFGVSVPNAVRSVSPRSAGSPRTSPEARPARAFARGGAPAVAVPFPRRPPALY
eukprot:11111233-Lingulodinium_polyedra.AAC.1